MFTMSRSICWRSKRRRKAPRSASWWSAVGSGTSVRDAKRLFAYGSRTLPTRSCLSESSFSPARSCGLLSRLCLPDFGKPGGRALPYFAK